MSAFIVEDRTINSVIAFMHKASKSSDINFGRYLTTGIPPVDTPQQRAALAQRMHSLNIAGVGARYGSADDMLGDEPFKYHSELPPPPVQAYKSLRCFLYQCAEGYVPERELFTTMERFSDNLAHAIVRSLDQFDRAQWA